MDDLSSFFEAHNVVFHHNDRNLMGVGLLEVVMCQLGLEATGRARLGLAQAKPGQASAWLGLASGSGLSF